MPQPTDTAFDGLNLESLEVGAAPVVAAFLRQLELETIFARHLAAPERGRPAALAPARVLTTMITNVLLARLPLYAVPQWLASYVPETIGLDPAQRALFNDDRLGRTLDALFAADQAPIVTDIVVQAVRRFRLKLGQLHNDSTTVTFHGQYRAGTRPRRGPPSDAERPVPQITFGFNKDHRPDLKQLVFELSVTADGAVPIHFRVHDGNTTDDQTHQTTWTALRELVGSPDFVYVADSKLAVSETLRFIAQQGGTFVSVLPRTRKETDWFLQYLDDHLVTWTEVRREPNARQADGPDNVYQGLESPQRTAEGFRVLWYRSSQKTEQDQARRFERLGAARVKLQALECRSARHAFRTEALAQAAADRILDELDVRGLLKVQARIDRYEAFQQTSRGRPGKKTRYQRIEIPVIVFAVHEDVAALQNAARFDGLFPLVTNRETFSLEQTLRLYKYQPFLEKRHEQMKSVLDVAPVFLKKPSRVASLLFVYFVALLVFALIERELRRRMKQQRVPALPLYPEARSAAAPTADLLFSALAGVRRHRLLDGGGAELRVFYDGLPPAARQALELLEIDLADYGATD